MRTGCNAVTHKSVPGDSNIEEQYLKSAAAGRQPKNRLADDLTETANLCSRADIGSLVEFLSRISKAGCRAWLPASALVRPLSFDLSGMGDPPGSVSSSQHNSKGHRGTQDPPPRQGLEKLVATSNVLKMRAK